MIWLSFPLSLWCSFELKYAVLRVLKIALPDPLVSSWPLALAVPESNPFIIINTMSLLFLCVFVVEVLAVSSLVFLGRKKNNLIECYTKTIIVLVCT